MTHAQDEHETNSTHKIMTTIIPFIHATLPVTIPEGFTFTPVERWLTVAVAGGMNGPYNAEVQTDWEGSPAMPVLFWKSPSSYWVGIDTATGAVSNNGSIRSLLNDLHSRRP